MALVEDAAQRRDQFLAHPACRVEIAHEAGDGAAGVLQNLGKRKARLVCDGGHAAGLPDDGQGGLRRSCW